LYKAAPQKIIIKKLQIIALNKFTEKPVALNKNITFMNQGTLSLIAKAVKR